MVDPEQARRVLKEYHATATDEEIVEDLWRDSPELARRLGVARPAPRAPECPSGAASAAGSPPSGNPS